MPSLIRPYPILKGEDARRFAERQNENRRKLDEKVQQKLLELQKLRQS